MSSTKNAVNTQTTRMETEALEQLLQSSTRTMNSLQKVMFKAMSSMSQRKMAAFSSFSVYLSKAKLAKQGQKGESASPFGYSDVKTENTTLPAVISKEVRHARTSTIEWTDLSMLPGAQHEDILQLGLSIFEHFGMKKNTPVKVIASMKEGDLINSNLEVNSVLDFLERRTAKLSEDNLTISFDGLITDYAPDIRIYLTNDYVYLAVLEENEGINGRYIYTFERDCSFALTNQKTKGLLT